MPKSRREQKRERREAKRKEKRREGRSQVAPRSIRSMLHAALTWPVMECWINKGWADPTQLNQILVTRRNPSSGEVYASVILVDRACLGVKNAYAANFADAREFRRELLSHVRESQKMVKVDIDLAAAIIKAGIEYAATIGFRPHRDYRNASILLQDADPDAVDVEIPVGGEDGKPFFIAGPYDNADKIVARLTQRLGPEGFHYVVPIGPDAEFFLDEEDGEILDEDDWEVLDDDDDIIEVSDGG